MSEYYPDNTKLSQVAEDWWRAQGKIVPKEGTTTYDKMYEAWVDFAFADLATRKG